MQFLTLTRIAALLAASGLASARIDVCAGGVKLDCDMKAATLLDNLDSLSPLLAFRSIRTFLEGNCDGACLSTKLKAELCEKAHTIKPLIEEKIFLEDIQQCFSDTNAADKSCHVSYECPPGSPEGSTCITNSCVSLPKTAAAAAAAGQVRASGLLYHLIGLIVDKILGPEKPRTEAAQGRLVYLIGEIVDYISGYLEPDAAAAAQGRLLLIIDALENLQFP